MATKDKVFEHLCTRAYIPYYTQDSAEEKQYDRMFFCYINHRLKYIRMSTIEFMMGKEQDFDPLMKRIHELVDTQDYHFIDLTYKGTKNDLFKLMRK